MSHKFTLQFDPHFNIGNQITFRYDKIEPPRIGRVVKIKQQIVIVKNKPVVEVESYSIKVNNTGEIFQNVTLDEITNIPPHPCAAKVFELFVRHKVGNEILSYYFEINKNQDGGVLVSVFHYVQLQNGSISRVFEYDQEVR